MPNIIPLPTPSFQAPGFVRPNDYSGLASSIDNLFTAYQQGKLRAAQLEAAQLQPQLLQQQLQGAQFNQAAARATFAGQNMGLSPEEFNQGLQDMNRQKAAYDAAQQTAPPELLRDPSQPAAQPFQATGQQASTVQHLIALHQNAMALQAQQAQAGLGKTQAEAANLGAEASLNAAKAQMYGGMGSGGMFDQVAQKVASGEWTPDQANQFAGRGEEAHLALTGAMLRQGVNAAPLQRSADAAEAGAKLTSSGSSQQMARSANSAYKQFDLLQKASDDFARTNNQLLNTPLLDIKAKVSPQAQVLKTALSTARIEYARAASGSSSPSDTFMAEAKNALPDGITPAQIPGVLQQLRNSLAEQARGQLTGADLGSVPEVKQLPGGVVQPAGTASPSKVPAIGFESKGYRFIGGNPAAPTSWRKL